MGEHRKIRDERDALACLRAIERSGKTLREWSHAHGVDGRSLRAWRTNLERRERSGGARPRRAGRGIVEVVARPGAMVAARYVLSVGEVSVTFSDDFSAETLGRVVGLLRSC